MDDPEGMLAGLDRGFGVLTFDGTQAYFVLDGQHRLRAIKDALRMDPTLGKEDLCILIVTHYDTVEGRTRTRRLFSNINKNAKQTKQSENIALDEDDGFAILTRRMLEEHDFLKVEGRVRVILSVGEDGELKLAGGSVPKSDPRALTTLTVLYDVLRYLGWDLPGAMRIKDVRPSDDILEQSYDQLNERLGQLLRYCGEVQAQLLAAGSAREVRAPKHREGDGHPFMRPVVQKAVARVTSAIVQQGRVSWDEVMVRLSELDWKLASAPWLAVFTADGGKMLVGKEHTDLLTELLRAHLAPVSSQAVKRALRNFKDLRGAKYPVGEEALAARVLPDTDVPMPPVVLPEEISANVDAEVGEPTPGSDALGTPES